MNHHHHATDWPLMWPLLVAEFLILGLSFFALRFGAHESSHRTLNLRVTSMLRLLATVYLLYGPWVFLQQIAEMAGTTSRSAIGLIPLVVAQSHVGRVWLGRLIAAAILAVVAWMPGTGSAKLIAASGLALVMLAMRAWGSHAIDKSSAVVAIYMVHEVAGALWVGSLMGLLLAVTPARLDWPNAMVQRVSSVAGWCVAVLVATGLFTAYQELGLKLDLLRYSAYGRVLIYKLATAAVVVAIGAYNRLRVVPAISSAHARLILKRNVQAECLILAGVLYWSALLANTPPPH